MIKVTDFIEVQKPVPPQKFALWLSGTHPLPDGWCRIQRRFFSRKNYIGTNTTLPQLFFPREVLELKVRIKLIDPGITIDVHELVPLKK